MRREPRQAIGLRGKLDDLEPQRLATERAAVGLQRARVAEWLNGHGVPAEAYSGEVGTERRVEVEERLLNNDLKAVVATSALGMGYDKPDLGFVVHYQAPGSVISYY